MRALVHQLQRVLGAPSFATNLAVFVRLAAACSLLEDYGYRVFLLSATGLHTLDYPRYGEYFTYSNFVAVSPASMPHLAAHIRGSI